LGWAEKLWGLVFGEGRIPSLRTPIGEAGAEVTSEWGVVREWAGPREQRWRALEIRRPGAVPEGGAAVPARPGDPPCRS
jgi:hypothetical protein